MYSSVHLRAKTWRQVWVRIALECTAIGGNVDIAEGPHSHVLKNVGAERGVDFLPAAKVSCSFVEQVAVPRRQQVPHEYHRCADGHQDEELARPALVHVLRALKTNTQTLANMTNGCSRELLDVDPTLTNHTGTKAT